MRAPNATAAPVEPPGPGPDVGAMVAGARRGDRAAQAALYQRFAPVVHGVLLARLQPADADDLTQEVFLVAMRRLGQLRDDGAFGAWALQIARNRAATLLRKRARRDIILRRLGARREAPASRDGADDQCARILGMIRELPEAYRETLTLRLVERLSGPEIAERTGLTPGSVRVNLHRGMGLLRAQLEAIGIDGTGAEGAS